jgi:hypothetical protein
MGRVPWLAMSMVAALLLPFPGPHVDGWIPMGAVLLNEDARNAPLAFFVLAGGLLAAYTGLVFGALSLVRYLVRRSSSADETP